MEGTGQKILLLDDDPQMLSVVVAAMERWGYQVRTASDGVEGLEITARFAPELIIADVMMPRMNGWSFVRALRSHHNRKMAMVPVIFLSGLSSEEDRILGFRLGADDYMPKPFRIEELEARVARALRTSRLLRAELREQAAAEPAQEACFTGDLEKLGLHAVLTMLEMEGKTGVLDVQGEGDSTCRVHLRDGRPVVALLRGPGEVRGAAAIYGLLRWSRGSFQFRAQPVEEEDRIKTSVTYLLMEAARRMDEAQSR